MGAWYRKELPLPGEKETFSAGIATVSPWWKIQGRWPEKDDEIILGTSLAAELQIVPGRQVTVGDSSYAVTGLIETGGPEDGQAFMRLESLQKLRNLDGLISRVYVSAMTKPMDDFAYKDPEKMTQSEYEKWYCTGYVTSIAKQVEEVFRKHFAINLISVNESELFLSKLHKVSEPERKRKIIGETFIEVFEREAVRLGGIDFLAQGTLYPDVIESTSFKGPSATIKSHHNVGGLPEHMKMELVEPLRELFKDEVRAVGRELGMPESIIGRHPFPGPGLAVRILGEVNEERIHILQQADDIYISELKRNNLYDEIWQAFAVLLPVQSVGVMGDERTYENTLALRAVTSTDGMTANWYPMPYDFLENVSNRIINEVTGINRVVYDISSKPPATIEWE